MLQLGTLVATPLMLSELKGVRIAQLIMVLSKLSNEHCIMMSVI